MLNAVAVPLLVVGPAVGFGLLQAHLPGGGWWQAAGFLVAAGVLGFCFLRQGFSFWGNFIPSALLLWSIGLVFPAVESWVLQERGREVTCTVRTIDRRVETSTSTDADGDIHTTTTTYYDYRLRCPARHPATMTTTSGVGRAGRPLQVLYDPEGRVNPYPAKTARDNTGGWVAFGMVSASILLRLAHAATRRNAW